MIAIETKRMHLNPVDIVLGCPDLLIQILVRVPSEPLLRFKTVSKAWLSLISDHQFIIRQTRHLRSLQPLSSLSQFYYQNWGSGINPISIQGNCDIMAKLDCLGEVLRNAPFPDKFNIIDSCNGLILCQYGKDMPYILFNPTTQKYRHLPKPLCSEGYGYGDRFVLAFDPLKSCHYKVIQFLSFCYPKGVVKIGIFSSESGAWKELSLIDLPDASTRKVFYDGAVHWISSPNIHVQLIVDEEKFVTKQIQLFVDEEKFVTKQIPQFPYTLPIMGLFGYFGESDDGLYLIKFRPLDEESRLQVGADRAFIVLKMDKETRCWSPKYQVDLTPLVYQFPQMNPVTGGIKLTCDVLYLKSEAEKGKLSLVLSIPGRIILYEVEKGNDGTKTKVTEFSGIYSSNYHDMHPYIECLAPSL